MSDDGHVTPAKDEPRDPAVLERPGPPEWLSAVQKPTPPGWRVSADGRSWRPGRRWLRLASGSLGPPRLALALAVASLPVVILGLEAYVPGASASTDSSQLVRIGPTAPAVWAAAVPAVLLAALIGGSVGGWVERRMRWIGALVALSVAWLVAIVALPFGPALLGLPYGTAYLAMSGTLEITTPQSLPRALGNGVFVSPLLAPLPFLGLAIGVVVWAWVLHAVPRPDRPAGGQGARRS